MTKKTIFVAACKNCPEFGNHVHYDGKIETIENDKNGLELTFFASEGTN
jgi:hypothetical protein